MSDIRTLTFDEIEALATKALVASNVGAKNASAVARSIAAAERDGQAIVGLSYLPTYCDHAACGKVDGHARPCLETLSAAVLRVDAGTGFAHPAIALGLHPLAEAARQCGIAALSVGNSYACGSLGYFRRGIGWAGPRCADDCQCIAVNSAIWRERRRSSAQIHWHLESHEKDASRLSSINHPAW